MKNNGMMETIRLIWQSQWLTRGIGDRGCRRQLTRLLRMRQSTTRWLEVLGHKKLRVKTDFQREVDNGGRLEIVRLSKLYFDRPHHSVILSISSLSPENLSAEEIKQIRQGKIPLGKIFGGNGLNGLRKTAISIKRVKDLRLARKLNVRDPRCFSKEYALWSGGRWVGTIKEIFNEESFKRIWR